MSTGKLAIVTGASSGIGLELAKCCAKNGFDVLIAADEPEIELAANELRSEKAGGCVETVQANLATIEGVDKLYSARMAVRSNCCWPMPAAASDAIFSTRIFLRFVE